MGNRSNRGAIIWLTGRPGAGKSTLSIRLKQGLSDAQIAAIVLDGDRLRAGLCTDLGFSDADRRENIRRAAEMSVLLAENGLVAIAALVSPFRADRQHVADTCSARGIPFAEVYVNASLAECERRDPKRLYHRARTGQISNFTGIDSPYEAPLAPAWELRTDVESVEESAARLLTCALRLVRRPEG